MKTGAQKKINVISNNVVGKQGRVIELYNSDDDDNKNSTKKKEWPAEIWEYWRDDKFITNIMNNGSDNVTISSSLQSVDESKCYGFVWNKNSCAANSCMTIEMHIFKFLLTESAQIEYSNEFPIFADAWSNINYFQLDRSWQYYNYSVLTKLWDTVYGTNVTRFAGRKQGDFILPFNKFRGMLHFYGAVKCHWPTAIVDRKFCDMEWDWKYTCHEDAVYTDNLSHGALVECLEVTNRVDIKWDSMQAILNAKFGKLLSGPDHPCSKCKNKRTGSYIFTNLSTLLRIESDVFLENLTPKGQKQPIDGTIDLQGTVYKLVGAVYHNGGHYTSRFLRQMKGKDSKLVCWDYDGMGRNLSGIKKDIPMVPVNNVSFPYTLTGYYKIVLLYYLREDACTISAI